MQRFPLAPMSGLIRGLTLALLALPVVLLVLGTRTSAPLAGVACALLALYLAVWLAARPARFELDGRELRVCFPVWTRRVPRASIVSAAVITPGAVRERVGLAVRVGVGGLWGAFGWLWSRQRGWTELYVSRTDGLVWIERRGALPLLVTPAEPAAFARALAG